MRFENDVKMYGIQTAPKTASYLREFENDVKMYGIQTDIREDYLDESFENDVKMYGIQTVGHISVHHGRLRMM